jgi:hypothetical protein
MISEAKLHQQCYVFFHNQYPKLRGLMCYNLNNSRNKIAGSINQSMGLQAGRSDLVYYRKGKAYMIEIKTEDGKQSLKQKDWQKLIEQEGFVYVVIRSIDEFINFIKKVEDCCLNESEVS